MTRHVLFFFHSLQKRTMYSRMLAPPIAAVTMEKVALADSFSFFSVGVFEPGPTPYQSPKYRAMGMMTESNTMKNQKMKMAHFRDRRE